MIGGVTRRGLPHLPGVPHLHVKNGKGTGAEMRPAIVSGIVPDNALVSYWSIFSLSLVTVPEVFVKVNSAQSPSCFLSGELAMLRLYVRLGSCFIAVSSLTYHEGDVNENVKKAIAWQGKTTTLHVHHVFFVHFFTIIARLWRT